LGIECDVSAIRADRGVATMGVHGRAVVGDGDSGRGRRAASGRADAGVPFVDFIIAARGLPVGNEISCVGLKGYVAPCLTDGRRDKAVSIRRRAVRCRCNQRHNPRVQRRRRGDAESERGRCGPGSGVCHSDAGCPGGSQSARSEPGRQHWCCRRTAWAGRCRSIRRLRWM